MDDDHDHVWGELQFSRWAGTPHRACQVPFCRFISLDMGDDDDSEEE